MQVRYLPKLNPDWSSIPGQEVAFAILIPDSYTPSKKYAFGIFIHGVGERSGGTKEQLENLVLGSKQPDGTRKWPLVTDGMKRAVDQYDIIMAIPTYEGNTFFEPNKVNFVYDFVKANYNIYDKMLISGFSLGGGAVFKYVTSSLSNANRVAYAIPCAAVSAIVDATIPGRANVPVHAFSNDSDPTVNVSNTKNQLNAINNSNPAIRALATIFRKDGHGGNNEAWDTTPPKAPGGQGFIDAAEDIYQVMNDIVRNGPRQMRSGTSVTTTTTRPPSTTTTTTKLPSTTTTTTQALVTAIAGSDQTVNISTAFLDGSRSTGWKSATWEMIQYPEGVSPWYPVIQSGGWVTTRLVLPKEGTYVFELTTYSEESRKGLSAKDSVMVNFTTTGQPPEKIILQKIFIPKTGKYVYVYDDGSTETKDN
jgi:hypothetical protein